MGHDVELLTIKDVAERLKYSVVYTKAKIIRMPNFPEPVKVTPDGEPRYLSTKINEFILELYEEQVEKGGA